MYSDYQLVNLKRGTSINRVSRIHNMCCFSCHSLTRFVWQCVVNTCRHYPFSRGFGRPNGNAASVCQTWRSYPKISEILPSVLIRDHAQIDVIHLLYCRPSTYLLFGCRFMLQLEKLSMSSNCRRPTCRSVAAHPLPRWPGSTSDASKTHTCICSTTSYFGLQTRTKSWAQGYDFFVYIFRGVHATCREIVHGNFVNLPLGWLRWQTYISGETYSVGMHRFYCSDTCVIFWSSNSHFMHIQYVVVICFCLLRTLSCSQLSHWI